MLLPRCRCRSLRRRRPDERKMVSFELRTLKPSDASLQPVGRCNKTLVARALLLTNGDGDTKVRKLSHDTLVAVEHVLAECASHDVGLVGRDGCVGVGWTVAWIVAREMR